MGKTDPASKSPKELKDALYQKVRAHYKLDDYLFRFPEFEQKAYAIQSECFKELDELKQELEKKIPTIATHHEASSYSVAISKRYEALCNKWATAHQTLSTKFLNELILPLAQITDHVIETYPAANMEDRIYKECNDPLVEMNILLDGLNEKIHDKRTEQELSLLDQVQKRSNEFTQ